MSFTTSNRLLDIDGRVPPSNVGVSIAKSLFKGHMPYTAAGALTNVFTVEFNFHFLQNLRRLLSGTTGDTQFSSEELSLYEDYLACQDGAVFTGERLAILEALAKWLVDEMMGNSHPKMIRSLASNNEWIIYKG